MNNQSGVRRTGRRATLVQAPDADPHPSEAYFVELAGEDKPESWGDKSSDTNDARLAADKPPHYA